MEKWLNKYLFVIIAVFQIGLFLVIKNDPFHGDAVTSCARVSLYIFENNLKTIWYQAQYDPGHPTLFPYLLASAWVLFGKSLAVSHGFVLIICFFILVVIHKIALIFIPKTQVSLATLMCAFYSVFVAQNALLLNTPLFFLWVLLCFYFLVQKKYLLFAVFAVLMELTHLQSNFFLLAFACIFCYQSVVEKKTFTAFLTQGLKLFLPAFLAFVIWCYFHHQKFGWTFLSPNYAEHKEINGLSQFIQSVFLITWRLLDNGMVAVYGLLIYYLAKQKTNKELLVYSSIILFVNALCMAVFLYNTIGHRYFLISQFLAIILLFSVCNKDSIKWVVSIAFSALVFGNFMYYPGKVIADTNLQYRNFFALEKEVKNNFDSIVFYSYAPISTGGKIRYLDPTKGLNLMSLNEATFDSLPAIIQSNINAEFTLPQRAFVSKNWYGNSYTNGAVFVNVFLNPKYYNKPDYFKLRESSLFEKKLQELKYKLRGE